MRLLELRLKAVGPFTDCALDLSAGNHGLHLIYGPNEAGKTSALRAVSYLLFGFPTRTPDNFVHAYDQLRVGAVLRHSDGEVLDVIRRKANTKTLRAADDSTVIPDERLERFLAGLDAAAFETLFGIDHTRLARAGEEIRTGQGRLGELLFAAGTGLAGLRQAQEQLQDRLDLLFKPRGQNPRINQALAQLRKDQEELKQLQLPSESWQQHDRAHDEARARAARLGEQIGALTTERNRLERIRAAVPLAARRRALRESLDELQGVVRLRDDFGNDCRAAHERLHLALHTRNEAQGALERLSAQLEAIAPSGPMLDAAGEIEALVERLGAEEKAQADRRSRLEPFLSETEHQARRLLRELGRPEDLEAAESLRLRADEPAIIRTLAKDHAAMQARRGETRETIARLDDQAARLRRELDDLGDPRDAEPLRLAVRAAQSAGDLDDRLDQARALQKRLDQAAARALARLPGWLRTLDDLEALAVPLDATIDRFETGLQAAEADLRTVDEKRAALADAVGQLEAKIQALGLEQDVPTETDLLAAREERNGQWQRIRSALVAGSRPGPAQADSFEQAQARTDALADRLRREADRVARKAEWISQLDRLLGAREAQQSDRVRADAHLSALRGEWAAATASLGVTASTPAELRAWLRRREEVVQLAAQARDARQALEPLERSRDDHRKALERVLSQRGEPATGDEDGGSRLAGRLARAERALERDDEAARCRDRLRSQADDARAGLDRERLRLKATEDELAAWRVRWGGLMGRIGLETDAAPEQAEVVLEKTDELFDALTKRREFLSRLRGMDRDAERFAADVDALACRVGPDDAGQAPGLLARALAGRLREARAAHARRTALAEQREAEEGRLRDAESDRDLARGQLERLCREARCESPDDLAEVERQSAERARLENALRDCEDQLLAQGGGAGVAEFAAEVERADADELGPRIERLDHELDSLQSEREAVNQTIGAERAELDRMDGGDSAAEAAESLQTTLARLHADIGRYSALKLAAAVLKRGIERYREKNQGPVLARAGTLFADLTGGSLQGLQIDDEGAGAVLKGVRADGRLIPIDGMSDGAHDQLYLALRLASLESWLGAHEPIPFVVDDILLNFDDRRALAALKALADLSRRTQVLFFTHHAHLVDLARQNLAPDVLFVEQLGVGKSG